MMLYDAIVLKTKIGRYLLSRYVEGLIKKKLGIDVFLEFENFSLSHDKDDGCVIGGSFVMNVNEKDVMKLIGKGKS